MKNFIYLIVIVFSLIYIDANAQWVQTSGANGSTIRGIAVNGTGIFADYTARYDSAGVILSTDSGINWSNVSTGLPLREIDAVFSAGNNLFTAENDAGVYISTNNGANWTVTALTVEYIHGFAAIGTKIFAASKFNGVYLSTDNGVSWNFVNSGLTNTMTRSIFSDGSNLFVGTYGGGGIFLSTNNGTSWSVINSGLTMKYVYSFEHIGSYIFAGTWNAGVFRTTNNGTNWTAANNGLPNSPIYALVANGSNLFAGTYGSGVYLSTNNGDSWSEVNNGLTSLSLNSLAISGSYLFAGGDGSGVWRRPLSEMVTDVYDNQNNIPENFTLSQNYPNPFNPSTKISWQSPVGSWQTLKVYDLLGNEVATLVNEYKPAGMYNVEFTMNNLSSGVYFYQLKVGDLSSSSGQGFIQTKKMILMK